MKLPSTIRAGRILAGVVLCAGLAWYLLPETRWSGGYSLTVHLQSADARPQSVACSPFHRREDAEKAISAESLGSPEWDVVADPFDGRPISLDVPVAGQAWLGQERGRVQPQYLAVVAMMPENRRVGRIVEIPDGRVTKELTVSLP